MDERMCNNIDCHIPTDRPPNGGHYDGAGCQDSCLNEPWVLGCNSAKWTTSGSHCCLQVCDDISDPSSLPGNNLEWHTAVMKFQPYAPNPNWNYVMDERMCNNIDCHIPTDRPPNGGHYDGAGCQDSCLNEPWVTGCNSAKWTTS